MTLHGIFALSPSLSALSLVPEQAELSPWLSPVLVLPVLQLLSCSSLTEALADQRTHSHNRDLAHSLLRRISREMDKPRQVSQRLLLRSFLSKTNTSSQICSNEKILAGSTLAFTSQPKSHMLFTDSPTYSK